MANVQDSQTCRCSGWGGGSAQSMSRRWCQEHLMSPSLQFSFCFVHSGTRGQELDNEGISTSQQMLLRCANHWISWAGHVECLGDIRMASPLLFLWRNYLKNSLTSVLCSLRNVFRSSWHCLRNESGWHCACQGIRCLEDPFFARAVFAFLISITEYSS